MHDLSTLRISAVSWRGSNTKDILFEMDGQVNTNEKKTINVSFCISVSEGQPTFVVQNLTTSERFEGKNPSRPWFQALDEQVSGPKLFGLDTTHLSSATSASVSLHRQGSCTISSAGFRTENTYVVIIMNVLESGQEVCNMGMRQDSQDMGYGKALIIFIHQQ